MNNYLKDLCTPRESVFNRDRRDVVLDLSDLLESKIDGDKFFEENFVTSGMQTLIEKTFRRLESAGDQASTFVLTQAMGGGKTHNMIALGLLSKNPSLRKEVLGSDGPGAKVGKVNVVGFHGRQTDAKFGIWGEIAEQLGKKELFKDYYSPLQAPGESAWINLLKGDPILILLDELPPYMEYASSQSVGNSDLSVVTTAALSNLLVAVNKEELSNVCIIISDLTASYEQGSQQITTALDNLTKETNRSALPIEPVSQQGDEIYHILRTRIFEKLPNEEAIAIIANEYAKAVQAAQEMDVTNESPDSYREQLIDSYPFHFSIRSLYARFKENPGFQQTRGLIRLMRTIVSAMYDGDRAGKVKLIHPYDLDLNNEEIVSEINGINPTLREAITHDIANNGNSAAELLDQKNSSGTDAQDVTKLLLVASLSRVQGPVAGLMESEVMGYLCAPGRDISEIKKNVLTQLDTEAWYLHRSQDGRSFFKNTQNLAAKLHSLSTSYPRESAMKELRIYLEDLFSPLLKDVYQNIKILPSLDEVDIVADKITLIITDPVSTPNASTKLSSDWDNFSREIDFVNRVLFLTGGHDTLTRVVHQSQRYKAINHIISELKSERVSEKDPQWQDALTIKEKVILGLRSAIQETFTTLVYPSKGGFRATDVKIQFDNNQFEGEKLIRDTLTTRQKFTNDITSDTFRKKAEQRLFGGQDKSLWSEVKRRSATQSEWPFHRQSALEDLKQNAINDGFWKEEGSYINAKPPLEKTSLRVTRSSRNEATGEAVLKITPVHGDTVFYETGSSNPTTASQKVENFAMFKTKELKLKFVCVDSANKRQTGDIVEWVNVITLKNKVYQQGDDWMVKLESTPLAPIRYTTDGSSPKNNGATYEAPFVFPAASPFVLAVAENGGIMSSEEKIDVSQYIKKEVKIDANKKATWKRATGWRNLTSKNAFDFVDRLIKFNANIYGLELDVVANDNNSDISYTVAQETPTKGGDLRSMIKQLQDLIGGDKGAQISLSVETVSFEKGQNLNDWVADEKTKLRPGEVVQ
jgi:hypothetical protein